jgi:heptosyltransferase I
MKILIIKMSSMGDIINTIPAIVDAGKAFPDIKFDWVVEENFAEIPHWNNLIDKVIPIAVRRWRKSLSLMLKNKEWQIFYKSLTTEKYDFIIDAQGLIKSAVISRLAHGVRIGLDWHSAREPLSSCFYNRKVAVSKDQHAITRTRQLFSKALGYDLPNDEPSYNFNLDFSTTEYTDNYLIFLHGASRENKLWPESNWVALAKMAAQKNYIILLPWSNDQEYKRVNNIADRCENVKILPKLNLASIAKIIKHAKGVVAVDSGLGHLAAALNMPMVSLYGPTNPKLIGSYGRHTKHLISENKTLLYNIPVSLVWKTLTQQIEQT